MAERRVERDELAAALEARRELGPELEPAVLDAFVERLEQSIAREIQRQVGTARPPARHGGGPGVANIILALGSFGCGIGATGAATGLGSAGGVVVAIIAWVAIACVNVAYATRR